MLPTIRACLDAAKIQLMQTILADEASIEARMLLMEVLKVNHAWLLGHALDLLDTQKQADFKVLIDRRLKGEPIAHILGYREFFGLALRVTPDTLIPRPDTETLVEAALEKINQHARGKPLEVLDLGTGTGAIALALAKHGSDCNVTAVDASEAAWAVAKDNAYALGIENTQFVLSDWFSALAPKPYHVIVSNPPYIEADDPHLQQGDLRFEPLSALASGADGLQAIRQIIAQAPGYLTENGWLMLEHGYNQADAVQSLLKAQGFAEIATMHDLGNQPRVTSGKWPLAKPV